MCDSESSDGVREDRSTLHVAPEVLMLSQLPIRAYFLRSHLSQSHRAGRQRGHTFQPDSILAGSKMVLMPHGWFRVVLKSVT
ncbi:hypothetical protein AcV5_005719 [Taiwanofungus camphoratus]|nr:hypothetical protein AcV5_005719 [Antrodia cinnamomea]